MTMQDVGYTERKIDFNIVTARLLLRPPLESDLEALWPHVTDARVTKFLAWAPHAEKTVTLGMIRQLRDAQLSDRGYHWLIIAENRVAGLISLIDVRRQHRVWRFDRAELSYWLGADFQSKGYATEAGKAVLGFAFKKLNFHKVILGHVDENLSSKKVALKLNFKQYGFEREAFEKDGTWHNLLWYDVLASEMSF